MSLLCTLPPTRFLREQPASAFKSTRLALSCFSCRMVWFGRNPELPHITSDRVILAPTNPTSVHTCQGPAGLPCAFSCNGQQKGRGTGRGPAGWLACLLPGPGCKAMSAELSAPFSCAGLLRGFFISKSLQLTALLSESFLHFLFLNVGHFQLGTFLGDEHN